jgi:transposase-like protein
MGYTEAYKREAIAKAQASGNMSQTARELGVGYASLQRWTKRYGNQEAVGTGSATSAQLAMQVAQLERQLAEREAQLEVLKKAISIVSQPGANGTK